MKEKAKFLRILGDETKLKIIQYLLNREQCACKIVPYTKRTQSTVSTHLTDLEKVGILESRRDGRNIYYKIKDKRVYDLFRLMSIRKIKNKRTKC